MWCMAAWCVDGRGDINDLADAGFAPGDQFVDTLAVNDHGIFRSQVGQDLGDGFGEIMGKHAHDLTACTCGVGQRPEDVEDRGDTQCCTDRGSMFHGRVMSLGKAKTQARFVEALGECLAGDHELDAQRFEDLG